MLEVFLMSMVAFNPIIFMSGVVFGEWHVKKLAKNGGEEKYPDFVTDEHIIEVKGAYFSEIHGHKNTEHEKALAAMENLDERDYVAVGKELPADIYIPWEERSKIRELLSNS